MHTPGRKSPQGDPHAAPPRPAASAALPPFDPPPHPSDRLWRDQITEEDWRIHAFCGVLIVALLVASAQGWL